MSARELPAAGITDPALCASYELCRRLNARHGRSYYLATLLLPPAKRPHVHALYGFARHADEFVDSLDAPDPQRLVEWGARFLRDWDSGSSDDPVAMAALHTAQTWGLPKADFEAFLHSMQMDITITTYATYDDLRGYMYGSAAVIGRQMVPILESLDDEAYPRAAALGEAFQLTNFIRDVAEDLQRGRVYLPQDELDVFGVSRELLAAGRVTPAFRELLRFQIARTRSIYRYAEGGVPMLHPSSRDCIRTAIALYGGILDAVEQRGYDVLTARARVSLPRRLALAGPAFVRARRARRVGVPGAA